MARRAIRTDRLIAVLGLTVLVLGVVALWFVAQGSGAGFTEEPASRRVLRQAREQLGRTAEVRLIEPGRGRVVCGYVAPGRGGRPVGFISRPNRMLLSHDPLNAEFRAMMSADCPDFPEPPGPRPVVTRP
ncbi:hypothetical protein [Brevundimonas sp.]|uniref:hypothetical protein n=1 Tax=Brevundimonas sp. TaxID=1871086 RepID=UPI002737E75E|nr:hypothetical protein [Brevundimonas sp.]MDP3803388.1 hypothetical protein [Brevundimonas sp.]